MTNNVPLYTGCLSTARLRKMEAFCQQQTGVSLHDYTQQLRDSESQTPEMQM